MFATHRAFTVVVSLRLCVVFVIVVTMACRPINVLIPFRFYFVTFEQDAPVPDPLSSNNNNQVLVRALASPL